MHDPEDEAKILQFHVQTRKPLPRWAAEAPQLHAGLELYFQAFFDLTGDRSLGWSPGPIPWTSIHQYGVAEGFAEDDLEELVYMVRAMDREYLEYHKERSEEARMTSRK